MAVQRTGTWISRQPPACDSATGMEAHCPPPCRREAVYAGLPVLLQEHACFKVAPPSWYLPVSTGRRGMSQIGKFITVYHETIARRAASELTARSDAGTARPLYPPTGTTTGQPGVLPLRRLRFQVPANPPGRAGTRGRTPEGALVADRRLATYYEPDWVADPFVAAGIAGEPISSRRVAGRYMIVGTLHVSPRGAVYIALDIDNARCCVLKQARRYAMGTPDGHDAPTSRHDAGLARLAPEPGSRLPTSYRGERRSVLRWKM